MIETIRLASRSAALRRALEVRDAGGVPLIGDARWSDAQWRALESSLPAVPEGAAWASWTSGSTAAPRVIFRDAASWTRQFAPLSAALGVRANDVLLVPTAPVSSMALFAVAHAHAAGIPWRVPRAHRVARDDLEGVTIVHCTPSALTDVLDAAGPSTTVRTALVGGDRVTARARERATRLGVRLVPYYGQAELSFLAIDTGEGLRAFPGVSLRVIDGELWACTRSAALDAGLDTRSIDGATWTNTRDLADIDDGIVTMRGRSDGAFMTAGATVVPEHIEAALETHPAVRAALVVPVARERVGTLVGAIIEFEHGATLRAAALAQFAAAHVGVAQRPRHWFAGPIPRTASGKPARAAASAAIAEGSGVRLA